MKRAGLIAILGLCVALIAPSIGSAGTAGGKVFLGTQMGGKVEVPDPGDPDGKGTIVVKVVPFKGKLCFNLEFKRIETPFAGHIHKAPRGSAGPVKVTLFDSPTASPVQGCITGLRPGMLQRMATNPERFYANVHNNPYPGGAIRGQLKLLD